MTLRSSFALPAIVLVCLFSIQCSRAAGGVSAASASEPAASADGHSNDPAAVVIDQAMLGAIKVDAIGHHAVPRVLSVAGKVQFDEDRVARVLAPLPGQIVELRAKVGDAVDRGQRLCVIHSREAAAAVADDIESLKDLELAEKTVAMTQDLFDHEAASKIALQQAQYDLAKARSRVARTEEALRILNVRADDPSGRVSVASPLAGTIIERRVTDGQFVQSDSTPIIVVADLSTVWVVGDILERDLRLVSVGDAASITTAAYQGERFQGRVNYISDVIESATRTAKVRVSVPNRGGRLKPEMFASIALEMNDNQPVLTVPSRALFTEAGRTWVYLSTAPGRFVRRAIDVADGEGPERRVIGGLRAGDRVVVDGALLLRQQEVKGER